MFLVSLVVAIVIGLLLKGDIRKLDASNLKGIYLAFFAFLIEFVLFTLIRKKVIEKSIVTYIFYLIQYILILSFVFVNRRDYAILVIGIGIFLNALAIFLNGGAMPVSANAMVKAGMAPSLDLVKETMASSEGLYQVATQKTIFAFLGDCIALGKYVISIGDIFIALGLMGYVIKEMKK